VDFVSFESHASAAAGLVLATPRFKAQSKNDRGGRDKPGHDAGKNGYYQP
jgi:hypothetical protein